jgi:hypothetical protein
MSLLLRWLPWLATAVLGWLGLKQAGDTLDAASRLTKWALLGSALYFAYVGARKMKWI